MALQTFKNLKPERQEEILQVCFQVFALHGYKSASLSEIIKKLNLAKGSFYRYFKNKKELYAFLIKNATERRLTKLDDLITNGEVNFFDLIKQNFIDKVEFDKQYPVIGGFLYKIMHEKDNSEVSDIIKNIYNQIIKQTQMIMGIERFKDQLNIKDAEMVAFQIFHMQLWLYDFVAYKYNIDYESNIRQHRPIMDLPDKELSKIIDQAVGMLRFGISSKEDTNSNDTV